MILQDLEGPIFGLKRPRSASGVEENWPHSDVFSDLPVVKSLGVGVFPSLGHHSQKYA